MDQQLQNKKTLLLKVFLSIAIIVAEGIFISQVIRYEIFPDMYRIGIVVGLGLVLLLLLVALFQRNRQWLQIFSATALILMLGLFIIGDYYVIRTTSNLQKMSSGELKITKMSLIALNSYTGDTPERLSADTTLMAMDQDEKNIRDFVENLQEENIFLQQKTTASYIDSARSLLDGHGDMMIFNEAFRAMIEEAMPDFASGTKIVHTKDLAVINTKSEETETPETIKKTNPNATSVYLSGIDTYGSIYTMSRSDVNIVVTLNTDTKRVQILSIPRDSYVPIAGPGNNQSDKLTHAGVYGVDASVTTLENLLETEIPYYFRVNFSSFEEVIDTIGGITISNPASFSAGGFSFPQGEIEMYGEKALAFVRERKSLEEGDLSRAKNQSLVIEAIFRKMIQPEQLLRLPTLMDTLGESIDTNMSPQEMMRFANLQIENPGSWSIERVMLRGTGAYGLPSYAMPGWDLYMYQIDEDSLQEVRKEINEIKEQ